MDREKIEQKLPHYAKGEIVKGFGRGSRELGFPTANFSEEVIEKLPSELVGGIYFGFAKVDVNIDNKSKVCIMKNKPKSIESFKSRISFCLFFLFFL